MHTHSLLSTASGRKKVHRGVSAVLPPAKKPALKYRLVIAASTAVLASGGILLPAVPASAAKPAACLAAEASYHAALAEADTYTKVQAQLAAAREAVTAAQRSRDALVAAAPAEISRSKAQLETALEVAAQAASDLQYATAVMKAAMAQMDWYYSRLQSEDQGFDWFDWELFWDFDRQLEHADREWRYASDRAYDADSAVTQAEAALLAAPNTEGIAEAEESVVSATAAAEALQARAATLSAPGNIEQLLKDADSACAVPAAAPAIPVAAPKVSAAVPAVAAAVPGVAAAVPTQAAVLPAMEEPAQDARPPRTNPGMNIQTGSEGTVTAQALTAPANSFEWGSAAWPVGILTLVAASLAALGMRRITGPTGSERN